MDSLLVFVSGVALGLWLAYFIGVNASHRLF